MHLYDKYLSGMLTAKFYTLGCKVNQYETEVMIKEVTQHGIAICDDNAPDIIVINSCTVTGESDNKARKLLRRCRREHPNAIIVLTGCYPQAHPEELESFSQADIIFGNKNKGNIIKYLEQYFSVEQPIVDIQPMQSDDKFENSTVDIFHERTRAFIKIEDGCNNFCTYCIIPTARGRIRSKPLQSIKEEVAALAQKGYKEIVLVGINLTAYGRDCGLTICDAVEACCQTDGIERVRLGSLEPDRMTDEIIDRLAKQQKLCPQFHLSLQSGCDDILRSMNRHYTTAEYENVVNRLRSRFPNCAITTDIMTGFPGETEQYFEQSLQFAKRIAFAKAHVFCYSRRPGTKADLMDNQIDKAVKEQRSHRLIEEMNICRKQYMQSFAEQTVQVILEQEVNDKIEGYTPEYIPVRVNCSSDKCGQSITVKITKVHDDWCEGELI